jgi:hypothetical protein
MLMMEMPLMMREHAFYLLCQHAALNGMASWYASY